MAKYEKEEEEERERKKPNEIRTHNDTQRPLPHTHTHTKHTHISRGSSSTSCGSRNIQRDNIRVNELRLTGNLDLNKLSVFSCIHNAHALKFIHVDGI